MPAFKYQSNKNVPRGASRQQAQARQVRAPQFTAPQQTPVLKGHTVQQQPVNHAPNRVGMAIADATVNLGNIFYKRSMQLADRQAKLEADEAIAGYRRSMTDLYYNEKDGLFNVTGAAGSKVYSGNRERVEALRDQFGANLSPAARMKYVAGVQGYHNTYLDQLARKQSANGVRYQQEVKALNENADAEDIHSFLREGNVDAIVNTIRDDDPMGTELENLQRRDRMVSAVMASADAQNLPAESLENLFNSVKHLASQQAANKLAEDVEAYKKAEVVNVKAAQVQAEKGQKLQREQNFKTLLEGLVEQTPGINAKTILHADLEKSDTKYLLSALEKHAGQSNQEIHDNFLVQASTGNLDRDGLKKAVADGDVTLKDSLEIINTNDDEIKRKTFPEKQNGDVKLAYDYLDDLQKDGTIESPKDYAQWKRALKQYVGDNPDKDPLPWLMDKLQPEEEGSFLRFFKGVFGAEPKPQREDGTMKFSHFTPVQRGAYASIKKEMLSQGKGDLDLLPESQVEAIVNNYLKQYEHN